jgi:rod shape-determining protein MreD
MRAAAIFGLVAGACEDALSAGTGAAWTVSTTLVAIFANYLTRWFFADSIPVFTGVVIAATLMRRMIFWVFLAVGGYPPGYARLHLHEALWEALLNAFIAAVALIAARRFEERPAR